jgi:hypothetical protein
MISGSGDFSVARASGTASTGARYWAATQLLLEPRFSLVAAVLSMLAYNFFFLPRSIL